MILGCTKQYEQRNVEDHIFNLQNRVKRNTSRLPPMAMAMAMAMAAQSSMIGEAARVERLWQQFFSDPSQWWDKRFDKRKPRFPDFKHKTANKALWIDNRFNPPWVHAKLADMVQFQEHGQSGFPLPEISGLAAKVVRMEQLWQEFFSDPSQWWDNRFIKVPKYPDFEHKRTHEGLWIEGQLNPTWVGAKVATALGQLQSAGGLRSRAPNFFYDGDHLSKLCEEGRLKEALLMVELMVKQNTRAPIKAYADLLKECARRKALAEGKRVHALVVESGLDSDIFLGKTLIDLYAKCGSVTDARKVFNTMPEHNVFSWTAIISAYGDHGQGEEAINLFREMQWTGIVPDRVAFVVVVKACALVAALEQGKQLHSDIIKSGFESDVVIANILVDMYAKCGCIEHAQQMFDKMTQRDVVSWNSMIAGYVKSGCIEHAHQVFEEMSERNVVSWNSIIAGYAHNGRAKEALALYEQMKQEGVQPNHVTYVILLKACASIAALEQGKQLHVQIIRSGFESDEMVSSALVDMYAKCGSMAHAHQVFDSMHERSVVSWTAMIAGYSQNGLGKDALALYEQMKQEGVQVNNVTYAILLKVCASIAALELGKQLRSQIKKGGFESEVIVDSALVDMYAKCGCIEQARQVFNKMSERDVVSWTAMIAGYAQQGLGKEALTLLEHMQRQGMKPDEATYVSVLSACSRSGLVDQGRHLFDSMCKGDSITPTMEHYACIVDLLGRAGCLADAEDFINNMPIQPDAVIWITLIGAARIHGHLEIGRHAFDCAVKLEPGNAAAYVLLSNMYAAAGRPDEVAEIRKEMKDVGEEKMPGCCWIELDNQVQSFVVGNQGVLGRIG
ncbi:hypothetical protein O6H91_06G018500 [Diphasiastrum complanatum]|uniref:Uncharacterized protein n=1 Tax=Diphasiastrum complanatum TaxID=34168 RepID=A0ACC2DB29_DIPCM|nr:hypothetical protein O6H91_06G018500 [Diphasiastrum complanatum]